MEMELNKKSIKELIEICKKNGIKGYSSKKKEEIIKLIDSSDSESSRLVHPVKSEIKRLNYIGSKYQLLEWLTESFQTTTGWSSFKGKKIGDLFSGTGVVSYHFRNLGCKVISNDSEKYSSIISEAFVNSTYNEVCKKLIETIQNEINEKKYEGFVGYITRNYSPYEGCERKFFTIDNASIIDYVRNRIEKLKNDITSSDYNFLLASLLISADSVSNVPAVYGCFLKEYKDKALKKFSMNPVHTIEKEPEESIVYNMDVLDSSLLDKIDADLVYLDPPYNERQYSKNYFPLNMIVEGSSEELKGKTGIPVECFLSSFCKKSTVEESFDKLVGGLKVEWIFISYNSESLIKKERMMEILEKYGEVGVIEREYKRFKSFEYNESKEIKEYLFWLRKVL